MYSLSEMPSWERRLARRSMSHEAYLREVDSQFSVRLESQPSKLSNRFFESDGNPTPILTGLTKVIRESWQHVTTNGETLKGVYVQGNNDGDFRNAIPLRLVVHYEGEYAKGAYLIQGLNSEIRKKAKQIDPERSMGSKDTIDLRALNAKPYGLLFDSKTGAWISFGKKENDHSDFLWFVHGLD